MGLSPDAQRIINEAKKALTPPGNITLPPWCQSLRPPQIEAINQCLDAFNRGIQCVVLDAPTGTGKTLIAESLRQALSVPATYLCSSKTLQDQFVTDFDNATLLKGRSNYGTLSTNREVRASDCNKQRLNESEWVCSWCSDRVQLCPYEVAKARALLSQLAVLNYSYWFTECNGPGRFSGRDFVICDEADMLESELLRFTSVDITEGITRKYQIGTPEFVTKEESWIEWVEAVLPDLRSSLARLNPGRYSQNVRAVREFQSLQILVQKLQVLLGGLREGGWVYVGNRKSQSFSFKPIRVSSYGPGKLWEHGKRFLLMSATVCSPDLMLEELGWDQDYEFVSVGSGFDVKNRQVVVNPIADMSRKANERDTLLQGIKRVLARHSGDRVLLHTVSYDLTQWLYENLRRKGNVFTYRNPSERDSALSRFTRTSGAVLLAPSFDRGIDLPDDACRVIIVCKVPYPYLGDKQISARLYTKGGRQWYAVTTARSIVQMTGRATRHANDYSVNYILDKQFQSFYSQNKRLFPRWWRDAVQWERF